LDRGTKAPQPFTGVFRELMIREDIIGVIGQVQPSLVKRLDLKDPTYVLEVAMAPILAVRSAEKVFHELPKFPAIIRDMALVVEEGELTNEEIIFAIGSEANKLQIKSLEKVELFDIYRGSSIPTGKKSMAYSLTFRAPDRTLVDAEVNEAHEQLKRSLQQVLKCEIRES
jgi:phenylalanyl-tRNA synthetase beta chain